MECVWFVYSELLQLELDKVKREWNTHYIRKSRHTTVPGIPDELFFLPEGSGHQNCGVHVSSHGIDSILNQRDIHAQANVAMNVNDDDIVDYFWYVV